MGLSRTLVGVAAVLTALVVLAATGCAANPPAIQWQRTFGDSYNYGSCVQQTSDGGFIVTGVSSPDTLAPGYPAGIPPAMLPDMYLLKTDSLGNTVWEKVFAGPGADRASAVRPTTDGGYVLAGRVDTIPGWVGTRTALVMKLDSLGNVVWVDSAPAPSSASGVELTADGGYISVGGVVFDSVHLRKLDSQGNLEWHVKLPEIGYPGGNYRGSPQTVQQTSDGGYITSYEFIFKTDSLGNVQWSRRHSDVTVLFSIRQTTDGGYIATGIAPNPQKPEHEYNLVLLKMDAQGNKVWKRIFRGSEASSGRCVRQTADGGYFVTGMSDGVYLVRTDSLGNELWAGGLPGIESYMAECGEPTADGGYVVGVGYVLVKLAPEGQ